MAVCTMKVVHAAVDLAKEWACSAESDGYANQYTIRRNLHATPLQEQSSEKKKEEVHV